MSSLIEEYIKSHKQTIDKDSYIFKVTESKIQIGKEFIELFDWQNEMLLELINIAYCNQNRALYYNTALKECKSINGFVYNIMILENAQIFMFNINTGKFREIKYKFEEIIF